MIQCLEANIAANNATNIRVEKTALGDRKGSIRFLEASAWGHVSQNGSEVPITTLVEIIERLKLPRVDFIKIDVEGSEFSIMRTSLDLINRFECLVLVELNSWTQLDVANVNPREFIEWILASFSHVFMLRRGSSAGDLLEPVTNGRALLYRNMVTDGCISDLLLTNAERRLVPSAEMRHAPRISVLAHGRALALAPRPNCPCPRDSCSKSLNHALVVSTSLRSARSAPGWRPVLFSRGPLP